MATYGGMAPLSHSTQWMAAAFCTTFVLQCLGYALLLPPLEEFDATGHFAYVSVLADRGEIPDFRSTLLDQRIDDATRELPRPYASQPPFDLNGGLTYQRFFSELSPDEQEARAQRYWRQPLPLSYAPGGVPNWQGQHPPLFYALLQPVYRMSSGHSLGVQLLTLRIACIVLACGSLVFWWLTLRRLPEPAVPLWLFGAAMILAMPSCWFDLGRLGNDSLAACCLAAVAYSLIRVTSDGRWLDLFLLSVACVAGLWTKAFFVPISAAVLVYLFASAARSRGWRWATARCLAFAMGIGVGAGWWFLHYSARYGMPLGSQETWAAAQRENLAGDSLTPVAFLIAVVRSALTCLVTFLWCGTWSWVRRPAWHSLWMLPVLLMWFWGAYRIWFSPTLRPARQLQLMAGTLLLPVFLGLAAHIIFCVRVYGIGAGTPGHYLYFAWPLVGVLLGGFWSCFDARCGRNLGAVALLAAVFMEWSGLWFSAQVFAGIITKTGSSNLGVGGILPTPTNLTLVMGRLQLLSFPLTSLVCLLLATFIKIALWISIARAASSRQPGR